MGLLDRMQATADLHIASPSLYKDSRVAPAGSPNSGFLGALRTRVQERLVETIDTTQLEAAGYAALLERIGEVIDELIAEDKILLTAPDRDRLIESITNDMLGLGPLEPLLQDNSISDILVNGCSDVWIERAFSRRPPPDERH
jgi:pilus assembly protein CpaF